jgi:phosphatidylinositol-3-phosphatase
MSGRRWLVLALIAVLAACTPANDGRQRAGGSSGRPAAAPVASSVHPDKVMVIAEENETYGQVLGGNQAPYLTELAAQYATIAAMDAGYPASCPSLPAYLLMTGGSTHGICDDYGPWAHKIDGPSIFSQVADAGLQWRGYAESMPKPCTAHNAAGGRYLVRHAPAPYYTAVADRCPSWDLPLGTPAAGALHDDVAAGRLPAYAFVTPDACDDMHGAAGCGGDLVATGDQWLARWLPVILGGPDYRAGRLLVVITWDEGSAGSNHIPTVVVGPTARQARVTAPTTHCGLLALEERILGFPLLGCARTASSPAASLGLA